jgi:hypothetical protein
MYEADRTPELHPCLTNKIICSIKTIYMKDEHIKRLSTLLVVCIDIKKGEAVSVTGRGGPQSCEMLRLPHFLDSWLTNGGEVVSLMCRPPFTPGRFLVFILLEAESTPGP